MFEQSMMPGVPRGKRFWTTCAGVSGQVLLVTGMVVSPMLWPQVLPPATFVMVVPHAPPGRPEKPQGTAKQRAHVVRASVRLWRDGYVQPTVPKEIKIIVDPPSVAGAVSDGPDTGVYGGIPGGSKDGVLGQLLQDGQNVAKPVVVVKPVEAKKLVVAEPIRVKVGGVVREPRLIRRVEPRYPSIAVTARVSGVVKVSGVIGIDGRIRELAVESGNVLLVQAALDAVRQWLYEPTQLNGDPVEVMTTIVVTFTLNR